MHEAKFNVHAYAATGEAKSVDTPAINRAIEAVAVAGGGTLVFLTGTYLCFTTRLRSDVELSLSRGCVIRNVTDFRVAWSRVAKDTTVASTVQQNL